MKIANTYHQSILRGGRLRKTTCGVVTYAPWLGTVSALAFGAMLALGSESLAGSCTETPANSGNWVCSGAADFGVDRKQQLYAGSRQALVVTDGNDFGIHTRRKSAFELGTHSGSTGLSVNLDGSIDSGYNGIEAYHEGSGALTITAAAVEAGNIGIHATGVTSVSSMGITANGVIESGYEGIHADHQGTGTLAVTANGDVTSAYANALHVTTTANATGLTIDANGDIESEEGNGIYANHAGKGALAITLASAASIEASHTVHGYGIQARTSHNNATDTTGGLIITANGNIGTSEAKIGKDGIRANHGNKGALAITAAGIHATGRGIYAKTTSNASDMTITAENAISAENRGIYAAHHGDGTLAITANGDIASTTNEGIYAKSTRTAGTMTITATGTVTGAPNEYGIHARHCGTGAVSVDAANASGIKIYTDGSISTTTADTAAIHANHEGSGKLFIHVAEVSRLIASTKGHGIKAETDSNTSGLTINARASIGSMESPIGKDGIFAHHKGSGDFTITAPTIHAKRDGIFAKRDGTGALTITANGDITARWMGIRVRQENNEALTIFANGAINANERGIKADLWMNSTLNITINNAITAEERGIDAKHMGGGTLNITVEERGSIASATTHGIYAFTTFTDSNTSTITINAKGVVTGATGKHAIRVNHGGAGAVSVAATNSGTNDISITAEGDINTADIGIKAQHEGSGKLEIFLDSNASIISTEERGIYAKTDTITDSSTSGLIIDAAGPIGSSETPIGEDGIYAHHGGTGALAITAAAIDADKKGIEAKTENTSSGMNITVNGTITAGKNGIKAKHNGNGSLDITAAVIDTDKKGIEAETGDDSNGLNITVNGTVTAENNGIEAEHNGTGALAIATAAIVAKNNGIKAETGDDSSDMNITVNGVVTAEDNGIETEHNGTGDLSITVASGASVSGSTGIYAYHDGSSGGIVIDVSGSVSRTEDDGDAIKMDGGASQKLILRPGFSIASGDTVTASRTDAVLEFAANTGQTATFALSGLSNFSGFADLDKTGAGTWELTGDQSINKAFITVDLTEGTLRFNNASLKMATSNAAPLTIASAGILQIEGTNSLTGDLANHGRLSFGNGNTDDTLTVTGNYQGSGALGFDVDFIAGGAHEADKLTIDGSVIGSSIPVFMNGIGAAPAAGSQVEVIRAPLAASTAFTGSGVYGAYLFELQHDGNESWVFKEAGMNQNAASAASYAPTLAELSSPPSTQRRLGEESYWDGEASGATVRQQNLRTTLQPGVDIGGVRSELATERLGFGFTMPVGNIILGADMWQGFAESRIFSTAGSGGGDIESHAGILTAGWFSPSGFYADTQLQYALFTGSLKTQHYVLALGNDGTGVSAAAELGYRFSVLASPVMTFDLAPQAQLSWSRIAFDDFSGPDALYVSLEDGDTATTRLGLAWNGTWERTSGSGHLYGGVNLYEPLDGRMSVNVSGVSIASEQQDTAMDTTLGIGYSWQNGYSLNLETGAIRRDEAAEYRANLDLRIEF